MIAIRKLLDFVFTQRELKFLDDIMPDSTRRAKEDEENDLSSKSGNDQLVKNASSGNVAIPLANGNILKIPVGKFKSNSGNDKINITEQLAKSGAWKSIDLQSSSSSGTKLKENQKNFKR